MNGIRTIPAHLCDGISWAPVAGGVDRQVIGSLGFCPPAACSVYRFLCDGTSLQVEVARNSGSAFTVAVFVDGVFNTVLSQGAATRSLLPVTMVGSGTHTVELMNSQQSLSGATTTGAWVTAIYGTNIVMAPVVPTRRLIAIGDSLQPSSTTNQGVNDFYGQLKTNYPGRVSIEGIGVDGYWRHTNSAQFISRLVRQAVGSSRVDIYWSMGTNDYGLTGQSPAALQTQLTTLLGLAQTAFGSRLGKQYMQTILTRGTETTLGLGPASQYRTAQAAAAAAVSSSIIVIPGDQLGMNTNTMYLETPAANALHPNDLGAAQWFSATRGYLGF